MSAQIVTAEFVMGARSIEALPSHELPEVAFMGRSNSGKSTLINRLTSRQQLARVSATPGKTRELNMYRVSLRLPGVGDQAIRLIDLPGFGYAKFSKQEREAISGLTVDYIRHRTELRVVCLLLDSKRLPEGDEMAVRNAVFEVGAHLLVIATKVDRLNRRDTERAAKDIAGAFGLERSDIILSGEDREVGGIWERIMPLLPSS